mgnify:CR=1 FL=1
MVHLVAQNVHLRMQSEPHHHVTKKHKHTGRVHHLQPLQSCTHSITTLHT